MCNEIGRPVAMIFRKFLDAGQIPQDCRRENLTPVRTCWMRSVADNYRPISFTSQICKTIESVIMDDILSHLKKQGLILAFQHGFRKGYSSGSNQFSFLEMFIIVVDAKEPVDAMHLYLAKAFDRVRHIKA